MFVSCYKGNFWSNFNDQLRNCTFYWLHIWVLGFTSWKQHPYFNRCFKVSSLPNSLFHNTPHSSPYTVLHHTSRTHSNTFTCQYFLQIIASRVCLTFFGRVSPHQRICGSLVPLPDAKRCSTALYICHCRRHHCLMSIYKNEWENIRNLPAICHVLKNTHTFALHKEKNKKWDFIYWSCFTTLTASCNICMKIQLFESWGVGGKEVPFSRTKLD